MMKRISRAFTVSILLISMLLSSFGCSPTGSPSEEGNDSYETEDGYTESIMKETESEAPVYVRDGDTTDFITSLTDIDTILERPYDGNVPTAFSEGIFTLHSYGWGFDNGSIFETGTANGIGMEIDVNVNGKKVKKDSAIWRPSHVTLSYSSPVPEALGESVNIA